MSRVQRKALKQRVRSNLKFRKAELKRITGAASRHHFKRDRYYKAATSELRKEIRFYARLSKRI